MQSRSLSSRSPWRLEEKCMLKGCLEYFWHFLSAASLATSLWEYEKCNMASVCAYCIWLWLLFKLCVTRCGRFHREWRLEIDLKSWREQELNDQEQEWEQVWMKTHSSCRRLHHIFGLHWVNFLAGMTRHNLLEKYNKY